jgi:hypothetical protein
VGLADDADREKLIRMPADTLSKRLQMVIALLGVMSGIVVSIQFGEKSPPGYFLSNALFYSIPQLVLVVFLLLLRSRASVVAGVSFLMATYLWAFATWDFAEHQGIGEADIWIYYLAGCITGAIGAVASTIWLQHRPMYSAARAAGVAVTATLAGILIVMGPMALM